MILPLCSDTCCPSWISCRWIPQRALESCRKYADRMTVQQQFGENGFSGDPWATRNFWSFQAPFLWCRLSSSLLVSRLVQVSLHPYAVRSTIKVCFVADPWATLTPWNSLWLCFWCRPRWSLLASHWAQVWPTAFWFGIVFCSSWVLKGIWEGERKLSVWYKIDTLYYENALVIFIFVEKNLLNWNTSKKLSKCV